MVTDDPKSSSNIFSTSLTKPLFPPNANIAIKTTAITPHTANIHFLFFDFEVDISVVGLLAIVASILLLLSADAIALPQCWQNFEFPSISFPQLVQYMISPLIYQSFVNDACEYFT